MAGTFTRAPQSTVLTDKDGRVLDSTTPIPVDPAESGAVTFATSQVAVSSSSATQLLGANVTRRAALVTNNDASIVMYVGTAGVATNSGHKLAAGATISIPYTGAIYAIAASGTPAASASEVAD
jgi:hypothetical protein